MKVQNSLRPHHNSLALAAILSVALWFIPLLRWISVPLQYANTHIHEGWHALIAVATGGYVDHIQVHANGNGETFTSGGNGLLIASAGYIGAAFSGALIIALSSSAKSARFVLIAIAIGLGYSLIVWVRDDWFGVVSCLAWIGALVGAAVILPEDKRLFAAQFLGVQQCLNSLQSLFFLVQVSGFGIKQSDAGNMEKFTGIPAIIWASAWCALSLVLMGIGLKWSFRKWEAKSPRVD